MFLLQSIDDVMAEPERENIMSPKHTKSSPGVQNYQTAMCVARAPRQGRYAANYLFFDPINISKVN